MLNYLLKKENIGKSEALRLAILDIMNSSDVYSHPVFWSPFIIVGNGSKGL